MGVDMDRTKGQLLAAGLLVAAVVGYVGVVATTGPATARPAPAVPAPPQPASTQAPPRGQLQQAVTIAEEHADGVAVSAEMESGAGAYEVKVVRGLEEIEMAVDVTTGQVVVLDREVEDQWDD